MLVFICPSLNLDVGYWVGLTGALWAGSASADVRFITSSSSGIATCPSGYVAVYCQPAVHTNCSGSDGGYTISCSSEVHSGFVGEKPSGIINPTSCYGYYAVCAKVCNP